MKTRDKTAMVFPGAIFPVLINSECFSHAQEVTEMWSEPIQAPWLSQYFSPHHRLLYNHL